MAELRKSCILCLSRNRFLVYDFYRLINLAAVRYIILIVILFITGDIWSQEVIFPKSPELGLKGVIYRSEKATEISAHTEGMMLSFYKGEIINYYSSRYKVFSIGYLRHPKEFRQSVQSTGLGSSILVAGTSYVYGKQNSFFFANYGMGIKKYISDKEKRRGVAVGYRLEGGGSLGFLKPYYLDLSKETDIPGQSKLISESYSEQNSDIFLDNDAIFGHSGFLRGFGEMKFAVGGYVKAGAHFAPGAYESFVRALEVGVIVHVYTRRLPIMVIEDNKFMYANLYLSIHLGKRS